jgi:hypothetical protein
MILVYTHRITARLNYIVRHIFSNILLTDVKFTTKIEEFIAFNGPKFSYSPQALGNEFHIESHPILYQQGIKNNPVEFSFWDDEPVFFQVNNSSIPFDIFAASFYLLSRYEEYLPHQLDMHERYKYKNSILVKHNMFKKPIVEVWAEKFKFALQNKFPDIVFPKRKFYFEPLIDVSMARLYKNKAFLRYFFGGINDLLHFRLKKFILRQQVYLFGKKDPYDTFDQFLKIKKKYNHPITFFHLLTPYTFYDHNISKNKNNYRTQIKFLADYTDIGLLTSYYAMKNESKIEKEDSFLENIIHKPLFKVRAHFNRIKIPFTYQTYNELELHKDYSMGYNHKIGFRAGTSIPFNFYDIENETETGLLLHPVIISDIMLKYQYHLSAKKAQKILIEQGETIKKYGGHFYPAFHNFILSNTDDWKEWNALYTETIKHFSYAKK